MATGLVSQVDKPETPNSSMGQVEMQPTTQQTGTEQVEVQTVTPQPVEQVPAEQVPADTTVPQEVAGRTEEEILAASQKGLVSMLEQDNPYMQLARKQGERLAESRGLGGSSLRGRAAQGAAIESAMPLVQQASTLSSSERQQAQQLATSTQQQQADIASREQLAANENQLQLDMQSIDVDYKKWLEDVTFRHQGILQGNQQAASAYSDFSQAAMNILNNPETTTEQKKASLNALKETLSGSLTVIGATADIDLSRFLPSVASIGVPEPTPESETTPDATIAPTNTTGRTPRTGTQHGSDRRDRQRAEAADRAARTATSSSQGSWI